MTSQFDSADFDERFPADTTAGVVTTLPGALDLRHTAIVMWTDSHRTLTNRSRSRLSAQRIFLLSGDHSILYLYVSAFFVTCLPAALPS